MGQIWLHYWANISEVPWARASVVGLRTDNGENWGNPDGCKFHENDADAMRMMT